MDVPHPILSPNAVEYPETHNIGVKPEPPEDDEKAKDVHEIEPEPEHGDAGPDKVIQEDPPLESNAIHTNEAQNQAIPKVPDEPIQSKCPFRPLHHHGSGLSDPSGMEDAIHFAAQKGSGVFPSVFLEKLTRTLVRSSASVGGKALSGKNFENLHRMLDSFCAERKCPSVFRFYCFLYNIMSLEVVPLKHLAKRRDLLERLQEDFILASQDKCRCQQDSFGSEEERKEHEFFNGALRMGVVGLLLIPLYTEISIALQEEKDGNAELIDYSRECNFTKTLVRIVCDHEVTSLFPLDEACPIQVNLYNTKPIMVHTFISQNLCFHEEQPLTKVISDLKTEREEQNPPCTDFSQLNEKIMTIFMQEFIAYQQGYKEGIPSVFTASTGTPLGLQLAGLLGPIKLLLDLLQDPDYFNLDELTYISSTAKAIQEALLPEDFDLQTENRKLLAETARLLHQFLASAQILSVPSRDELEVGVYFEGQADINMTLRNERFTVVDEGKKEERGVCSSGITVKKKVVQKSRGMRWPIDVMLRWFGCKKLGVSPATILDIEYLKREDDGSYT